jgi:hypothetical protein
MDLEIDIECRACGLCFKQNFSEMPHGRSLKCPFCYSASLELREQTLVEKESGEDAFEVTVTGSLVKRKIKL